MNAEDLGGDDSGDGEAVEDVYERLPGLDVTPSFAFVVKAVYCVVYRDSWRAVPDRDKSKNSVPRVTLAHS